MNTETIELTGAKLKGDLFCHYSFQEEIGEDVLDSGTIKSGRPIHDDLRNAFKALTMHMPVIMEDLKPGEILDINSDVVGQKFTLPAADMIARFHIHEIVIDPETKAVSLIGTKSLDLGLMAVETPFVKFDESYHYALELQMGVDLLCQEVKLYIDGKEAPKMVQTDMFADSEPAGTGTVVTDEEPKPRRPRGRPKKKVMELDEAGDPIGAEPDDALKARAENGYTPESDDEFNQPESAFRRDPSEVED